MAYTFPPTDRTRARYADYRARLFAFVFGDRYGLLLFVGALAFFGLFWRVGFFITDNYTIANGVYNAADGHLRVTDIVYGPPSGEMPGMVAGEGGRYSRNVGQIVLTLPVMWALEALAAVSDLRIVLLGLWSGTILLFGAILGRLVGRESLGRTVGAVAALVVFGLSLTVATELESRWLAHLALQLTSMVAAGLTGVVIYRLVSRVHGFRPGLVAGVVVVLATPVGFWASIPKRHTYFALFAAATAYSLYRSREASAADERLTFRALAYAIVGFATWFAAADALILIISLAVVDFATAPSNSRRELATILGVFGLSLLPFFATNQLIAGNPLLPTRFVPAYQATDVVATGGDAASPASTAASSAGTASSGGGGGGVPSGGSAAQSDGAAASTPLWASLVNAVEATSATAVELTARVGGHFSRGVEKVSDTDRLVDVFVRSGYIESVARKDFGQSANLSLLEAMPVFAALVLLPKAGARRVRAQRTNALVATDLFVVTYAVVLTLLYLPRLPLHATITVRYLLPMMPLLVYAAFRFAEVRELLRYPRALGFSYVGTVIIGSQVVLTLQLSQQTTIGEALQIHAWLNLVGAACLGGWLLCHARVPERARPVGAVVFGLVCGLTTVFLLLSGAVYLATDSGYVLPVVDWLHAQLSWL